MFDRVNKQMLEVAQRVYEDRLKGVFSDTDKSY